MQNAVHKLWTAKRQVEIFLGTTRNYIFIGKNYIKICVKPSF